jgi:hypothetical protein
MRIRIIYELLFLINFRVFNDRAFGDTIALRRLKCIDESLFVLSAPLKSTPLMTQNFV